MPVDILARANAGAAAAVALQALGRTATIELFSGFAAVSVDPSISTVTTTGFATAGIGRGTYVSDAQATAALASRYPAFCRKSANNRYFRLVGEAVSPEQAGAAGTAGVNDQPAIQAALDYATAVGIPEVHLKGAYEAWCPQRTSAYNVQADDGHLFVIRGSIAVIGIGAGVVINRRNYQGGDPLIQQPMPNVATDGYWRGGGFFWTHNGGIDQNTVVVLRNFKLDGGINQGNDFAPAQPVNRQDCWDTTDKGIWVQDLRSGTLLMEDMEVCRFRGEINYWAAYSDATSTDRLSMTRCWIYETNGDANNAQGGYAEFHHCRFGRANSAEEALGRSGHRYFDCEFYDCVGVTFIGGPDPGFVTGQTYDYPVRRSAYVPWTELQNCTFRNCGYVTVNNWVRGRVTAIDTYLQVSGSDVDLIVDSWLDNLSGITACIVQSQATSNADTGGYTAPPSHLRLKVNCYRTKQAADAGRSWAQVFGLKGAFLRDTVSLSSDVCEYANAIWGPYGSTLNMVSIPAIRCADYRPSGGAQRGGGTYDFPAGDKTYCPTWPAILLYPTVSQYALQLSDTDAGSGHQFIFDDGAPVRIINGDNTGKVAILPVGGPFMALKRPRALKQQFDYIDLVYDKALGKFVEAKFVGLESVPVALTDAATIAVNFGYGTDFVLTLAGNRTLGSPSNATPGQRGTIQVAQDATGNRTLIYGSAWRFPGGAASGGLLSSAAGAVDTINYVVGNGGLVYATIAKGFAP